MSEADILELVVEGTYDSNQIINTFGFLQKSATAGFLGPTLITEWMAGAKTQYLAALASGVTLNSYRVSDVVPGGAARAETFPSSANTSNGGVSVQAQQVATLIGWQTSRAGRSYRGRTYLGPVPGVYATQSRLIAAGVTAYAAFVSAMLGVFGPAGSSANFQFAVISRVQNGAVLGVPIATGITSGIARTVLATQRRRRIGVGA